MMETYLDKQEWTREAERRGFTVLKDFAHKGNATAYRGNRTMGSWSVNRGEGKLRMKGSNQ